MKKIFLGLICGVFLAATTAVYASDTIQAYLFSVRYEFNGQTKELDSEYTTLNYNGHAYVPIRFLAENTGANVEYVDATKTIYVVNGKMDIKDPNIKTVTIGNLILIYDATSDLTNISGKLDLLSTESQHIQGELLFYDQQNKLISRIAINNYYQSGINTFTDQKNGNFTNYASVKLIISGMRFSHQDVLADLKMAAINKDDVKIDQILSTVQSEKLNDLFIEFMENSINNSREINYSILDRLLKQPVNLNIQDQVTGYTPLIYAAEWATNLVGPLVLAGADVNINSKNRTTALIQVANKNSPQLVQILLDRGADVNVRNDSGYTPLLAALVPMYGNYKEETVSTIKNILAAKAIVDVKDNEGNTPLQIIQNVPAFFASLMQEIRDLLMKYGAK
ncbi:ankyrin repeat domain-containing protein [Paenibacillus frigoriresistens]|uniref:ankyrin repeat domain-containing protein n=1 Tax=Paenibacillus alginolyticus TaxID=59839 RepID=UPI001564AE54|nr:ankyrin repeat domain-containing protein [Paenibacillus frigoriresistens]NRF89849.1 ankyrin repeat domain-containing protein [Paenibacillus frigoriresistens]